MWNYNDQFMSLLKDVIYWYMDLVLRVKLKIHIILYNYRLIQSEIPHGFTTFFAKRGFI